MKKLKPSHRDKRRYLLIEGKDANKKTIEEVILEYMGIFGFAEAGIKFLKNDKGLVISVERKSLDRIRTSFLISEKDIKIKKVSGSIRKLIA